MISIAIDGPSGAGKSTLANEISKQLGYIHLDTGAIYRTVALYYMKKGIDIADTESVIKDIPNINIRIEYTDGAQLMFIGDENVTPYIRTSEVSSGASKVSAIPEIRTFLLELQRDFARKNNVIMDGRDIGTVILPNATVKFFMTASDLARAKRRCEELKERGEITTVEEVLKAITTRDANDRNRKTAPAIPADDAIMLDNSGKFEETLATAMNIIRSKIQ